ncbi:MAG: FeoB-associated Cys-rich membrane protein [Ruminococcus sp.]|nr:FeoB-associated Cys-rich membrane protein [Ruminococcus sp.]
MLEFLSENFGTIIVLLILIAVVAVIIISHFVKKKNGKPTGGCGCGCSNCAMAASCHSQNKSK